MQLEFPFRSWVSCFLTDARWPYENDNFSTWKAVEGIEFYPFASSLTLEESNQYLWQWLPVPLLHHETRENSITVKVTETPVIQQEATPGPATPGWAHLVSSTLCWDLEKVLKLKINNQVLQLCNAMFSEQKNTSSGYSRCSSARMAQCSGLITQTNAQPPEGRREPWDSMTDSTWKSYRPCRALTHPAAYTCLASVIVHQPFWPSKMMPLKRDVFWGNNINNNKNTLSMFPVAEGVGTKMRDGLCGFYHQFHQQISKTQTCIK